jgi:HEAT repeat protein
MDAEAYLVAEGILAPQAETATGTRGEDALFQFAALEKPAGYTGTPKKVLELASKVARTALVSPEANPEEVVVGLARVLAQMSPDELLAALSGAKQEDLAGRPVREVAAGFMEDAAAGWAAERLSTSPGGPEGAAAEEDVVRVLLRGLQTTRRAERLLEKLGNCLEEANLPSELFQRLRQELLWSSLSPKEKHARLMRLGRHNRHDFHRLVNYIKESLTQGRTDEAIQAATHFFSFLERSGDEIKAGLRMAPDLLAAMAGLSTLPFMNNLAERLAKELSDESRYDRDCHGELANSLAAVAQIAGTYEHFELVHSIGSSLDRTMAGREAEHSECCRKALERILTPAAAERLIELYVEKRGEQQWPKMAASLLKWVSPMGVEKVFQRLEDESSAANRMRLMRFLGQLGPVAKSLTHARLSDKRWYVVRNACIVAGEQGDPDLPKILSETVRHPDRRVQQAAVTAIIKSHSPGGARVLAEALPHLHPQILDLALDELSFLKDPTSILGIEKLVSLNKGSKNPAIERAIRVLGSVPSEFAVEALGRILFDAEQWMAARKAALDCLGRSPYATVKKLLVDFLRLFPNDPLLADCQKLLGATSS